MQEKDEKPTPPEGDIERRKRAQREKKEKLKSPMFFISPVRLSVRNLDKSVGTRFLLRSFKSSILTSCDDMTFANTALMP